MAAIQYNPNYGYIPGAPQGLNWWEGNTFRMSGLPLPPPPVVPRVDTTATNTPQDVATQQATGMLGGGTGGSGGPGSGPGGIGGASGGGQDTTTSGYQGVYAQSPVDLQSRFGETGGLIGAGAGSLSGIPGVGTGLGFIGGMIDAGRINDTLAQYGMPGHVNPWGAGFAQALAGIGVPFTDLNLARAFNVPTAQQRLDAIIAGAAPGLYNDPGYGALAANAPLGPATVGEREGSRYPAGFADWSGDIARSNAVVSPTEDPNAPMPGSSFYGNVFGLTPGTTLTAAPPGSTTITGSVSETGKGAFDAGGWGEALGGKGGEAAGSSGDAGGKGDVGAGQEGGSGDTSRDASDGGGYKYRGGLIGAPPGRYAVGGPVAMPGDNITPQQFGLLRGVNPPGPDDQIGALQTGEGVLTRATMKKYPGLLDAANAGKLPKRAIGLLAVAPAKPRRPR